MSVVPPEEFIAAIAAEGHAEAGATRLAAHQVGGQLGGIGEGLAVDARQGGDQGAGIGSGEGHFSVVGAEVRGHGAGIGRLVEAALAAAGIREGNGEAAHRPAAGGLQQGGDQRRIDAAGEESAERHIGDGLLGHCLLQGSLEGPQGLGLRAVGRGLGSMRGGGGLSLRIPPGPGIRQLAGPVASGGGGDRHQVTGGELLQAGLNAERRRDAAEAKKGRQCCGIELRGSGTGQGAQGGQLGGKGQHPGLWPSPSTLDPAPVEGLLAKTITGQPEHLVAPVVEGERSHAGAALEGSFKAPGLDGGQQGFGVGMAAPGPLQQARALELLAQDEVVVDLAVEGDHQPPGGTKHRLVAGRREIEDRKTPVGKSQAGLRIAPHASVIGAAVGDGVGHCPGLGIKRFSRGGYGPPQACQAAHSGCQRQQPPVGGNGALIHEPNGKFLHHLAAGSLAELTGQGGLL